LNSRPNGRIVGRHPQVVVTWNANISRVLKRKNDGKTHARSKATQAQASGTSEIRHAPPPPTDDSPGRTRCHHTTSDIAVATAHRRRDSRAGVPWYLERGGSDGQDFDDWIEAEQELRKS
jgi:hypothetical protein